MTITQTIKKVHLTKLDPGDTDPGAAAGEVEARAVRTIGPLASGRTWKRRVYTDDTVLPVAGLWLPSDEASLEIWIDAADVATIIDTAGAVTQILDKSGNGAHFSAISPATPVTGARTINSLNVLDFDGSAQYLSLATYAWPAPSIQKIWMVLPDAVDNSANNIMRFGNTVRYLLNAGVSADFRGYVTASGGGNLSLTSPVNYEGAATIFRTVMNYATGAEELYINGTLADSEASGYLTPLTDNHLYLMGNQGVASSNLDGALGEYIYFSDPDNAIGQKAEGQLAHKWGLAANLPGGHPYKSEPPAAA